MTARAIKISSHHYASIFTYLFLLKQDKDAAVETWAGFSDDTTFGQFQNDPLAFFFFLAPAEAKRAITDYLNRGGSHIMYGKTRGGIEGPVLDDDVSKLAELLQGQLGLRTVASGWEGAELEKYVRINDGKEFRVEFRSSETPMTMEQIIEFLKANGHG